jgi:hypothetical protein
MAMNGLSWALRLAQACTPDDAAWAEETARRYVLGGRSRAALLTGSGERHGGFGGVVGPDQFVLLLDALRHSGQAVLAFLESDQASSLAGEGALVVAVADYLASRRAERAARADDEARRRELETLVDGAIDRLAEQLAAQHRAREEADRQARHALLVLAVDPGGAAEFVRSLDRSLRRGGAAVRDTLQRRLRPPRGRGR